MYPKGEDPFFFPMSIIKGEKGKKKILPCAQKWATRPATPLTEKRGRKKKQKAEIPHTQVALSSSLLQGQSLWFSSYVGQQQHPQYAVTKLCESQSSSSSSSLQSEIRTGPPPFSTQLTIKYVQRRVLLSLGLVLYAQTHQC